MADDWFVLNARDARWLDNDAFGAYMRLERDERFEQVGVNISVLRPGQPMCLYHGEEDQEDFLVLSGEGVLLIEGEERPLRAWDFVHCPPWTEHVIVGAGNRPALVLAAGVRKPGIVYPANEAAIRNEAGVREATKAPAEAYADYSRPEPGPAPELP